MNTIPLTKIDEELKKYSDSKKAILLQRFFKTGKGEYGEGDVFLGINVPNQRRIAKEFKEIEIKEIQELLNSKEHEKRLIALLILIEKYKKETEEGKKEIFEFYLKNAKKINNWDLVDLSAGNIVGSFLLNKDRGILYKLAHSENLWEKRISIISTGTFIREKDFEDTIKISEILLKDENDLIHKAVGWMLREIGKRDEQKLEDFLNKHCKEMPRTMLRYAIEKFDEEKRQDYLKR